MRIGLDIDNVILNTDDVLLENMLLEDKKIRNSGIINKEAYIFSGMFDWSKEELIDFFINNMERIAKTLNPLKDSIKYINKILEDGHQIYLISNRSNLYYKDAIKTTKENLKDNKINYTKLIITQTNDKSDACKNNNIDIMFDDRPSNCFMLLEKGVKCCLVKTIYENRTFDNLNIVNNWEEIYLKINDINK
jgi:Uncharacterized conserved protein